MSKQLIQIRFDGACCPMNPGGVASWGMVVKVGDQTTRYCGVAGHGEGATNNVAEYMGLIAALGFVDQAYSREHYYLDIRGDSKLVINMVDGAWGGLNPHEKYPHLRKLLDKALELLEGWEAELKWIPRHLNEEADALSNKAYDEYVTANPDLGWKPHNPNKPFFTDRKRLKGRRVFKRKLR